MIEFRMKIYSTGNSNLDYLLNNAFTQGYQEAQKEFTRWDETDNLKRAKDSDILAEEKKKKVGYGGALSSGVQGAALGAGIGAAANMGLGAIGKNRANVNYLGKAKRGGVAGAVIGASIMAGKALKKRRQENSDINFYNDRLGYAKRQALRRERKDWKENMTQREGYSY